ncbi:MAG: hypothetical protein OXP28_13980 [Gammaproteobacteria bacterium]|nr:hypothetical protein [Gammaproteobacteria bacterium]
MGRARETEAMQLPQLVLPTVLAVIVVLVFRDPTYRFPLLALLLPLFVLGGARALGVQKRTSATRLVFTMFGFAGFAVGWLLTFAVLGFGVVVALFPVPPSGQLLKQSSFWAAGGLVLAAWFWWPWYAREVLARWPAHHVRIWTSSGNRWDRLYIAWRMQRMAESGGVRWRGFGATAGVVALVMMSTVAGPFEGWPARMAEVVCIVLLPWLHLVIVREADTLCGIWSRRESNRDVESHE